MYYDQDLHFFIHTLPLCICCVLCVCPCVYTQVPKRKIEIRRRRGARIRISMSMTLPTSPAVGEAKITTRRNAKSRPTKIATRHARALGHHHGRKTRRPHVAETTTRTRRGRGRKREARSITTIIAVGNPNILPPPPPPSPANLGAAVEVTLAHRLHSSPAPRPPLLPPRA